MSSVLSVLILLLQPASQPTAAPASQPTAAPASQPAKPGATDAQWKTVQRGAQFTVTDSITMDGLMAEANKYAGQTVRVSGTVSAVCRKKGCWMTLGGVDALARARVTFKDYAFFVPLDAAGSKAEIEGVVELKVLSDAERAHLADDAGKPVDQVPKNELRLMASAVQLVR